MHFTQAFQWALRLSKRNKTQNSPCLLPTCCTKSLVKVVATSKSTRAFLWKCIGNRSSHANFSTVFLLPTKSPSQVKLACPSLLSPLLLWWKHQLKNASFLKLRSCRQCELKCLHRARMCFPCLLQREIAHDRGCNEARGNDYPK